MDKKRIYRTEGSDAKLAGVCGGISEYFDLDPSLVRAGFLVLALCASTGFWAYIICALVFPRKSTIM